VRGNFVFENIYIYIYQKHNEEQNASIKGKLDLKGIFHLMPKLFFDINMSDQWQFDASRGLWEVSVPFVRRMQHPPNIQTYPSVMLLKDLSCPFSIGATCISNGGRFVANKPFFPSFLSPPLKITD